MHAEDAQTLQSDGLRRVASHVQPRPFYGIVKLTACAAVSPIGFGSGLGGVLLIGHFDWLCHDKIH